MAFHLSALIGKIRNAEIVGNADVEVNFCSSGEDSLANSICFVASADQFERARRGEARVFVLPQEIQGKVNIPEGFTVIFAKNHALAHAQLTEMIHGRYRGHETNSTMVHSTAVVAPTASIGKNVRIGPNAHIGDNVRIGDEVFIGANSVIEEHCKIGNRTHIWPNVFIGRACVIREECHIHPNTTIGSEGFGFAHDEKGQHHRIPQLGNVIIQPRVEIGSNVAIDRATFGSTIIGEGTKIDNLVHVAHNVRIGKNCLLTAGFMVAGSSVIGDNVITGGGVYVTDHVEVCSNVRLAGWSGVNNDVTKPGDYGGHPLQPVRDYLKTTMCLPHLPEFRKVVRQLQKKFLTSDEQESAE